MEFFNSLNLTQIKGGTKLKQGDLGSVLSYSLTDENGQEITSFDNKTAYINLVLDDKIWFTTTTLVDISRVTFRIDKAIPIGLYYLEIKIDDYIFPSDRDSIILIEEGSTPYDLKELVPNYDINMTIKGILSDLSQKGIDIRDLKTKMNAIYNIAIDDHAEVAKARGKEATLGDRLDRMSTNIDDKASAKWVEKSLNNILSTTPKASLASFEEIQSTYPNGANGIVVARDSGKWYYWSDASKTWMEGGTYQSKIIGENEVSADNVDFVQGIQQMLVQKVGGSAWVWQGGEIRPYASANWARYMPIHLIKNKTYYIHNARGYFSHVVSVDGTRQIKQLSTKDALVSTEYTATEDSLLYISTNVSEHDEAPKVFNASIAELKSAHVDFNNLPNGYVTLSIPKLTLNVKPEELSFVNVVKQLVDEFTFKAGEYWTGRGDEKKPEDTWGTYPKLYVQAGKTYGLKNVRGYFTHYFDVSGNKIKTFATKDVLISQDYTPTVNGYFLITRRLTDPQSKVIQGGLSKASLLKNLDYGTFALESTVNFLSDDVKFVQETKQMLTDQIAGAFWFEKGGYVNLDVEKTWSLYSPVSLIKDKTYFIVGVRGFFTYVTSADNNRIIKRFSETDVLVTTEYTPTEDSILYVTTRNSDPKPKVFSASVEELSAANVDINNLPDDYISRKIPKLSVDVKATDLDFVTEIKQILDENTFIRGKYYTGKGKDKADSNDWGVYLPIILTKGVKYGLKDVRGVFTYFLSFDDRKLKQFSTKDILISQDYTPTENGYLLITRRLTDPQSKVIKGGLSKASLLKNLDYGTFALESTVNFLSDDNNSTRFGQKIDGIDSTQKTTVENLGYMSPIATWTKTKGFIDNVDVYVKDAGTYNFAIGNIDQNQLIVSPRTFTKKLNAGYNHLNLRHENIPIFYGEQMFFESKDNTVYAPKGEQNLIQDAQHTTSNDGYSGKIMYRTDNAIPFTYVVAEEFVNEKVDNLISTTKKLESIVSELEIFKRTPTLVSPNGTKFRLLVDNNGNLSTVSSVPSRVAVFGNSITSHEWLQGIGMAASSKDKDYFTLVKNYILSKNPRAIVERSNGSAWESEPNNRRQTFEQKMMSSLKPDTDIVILQFGDNLNTDEKRKNLETDIPNLISWIRNASPKALIYWVGIYYASQDFVDRIKRICEPLGVTFVDIYQYSKDPKYKSHVGAIIDLPDGTKYTVTDQGVASHPGDLGHKAIADEIIKNFLF